MVEGLKETYENYLCLFRVIYGHTDKIPKSFRSNVSGNFRIIKKFDSNRLVNKTRKESSKNHFDNMVHNLCMKIKIYTEAEKLDFQKENVAACTKIVTNAICCLKHLQSSADFVQLNDKNELTSNSTCASKKDGSQQFFYYKTEVYQKLSEKVKEAFTDVKPASFSLDKLLTNIIHCSGDTFSFMT